MLGQLQPYIAAVSGEVAFIFSLEQLPKCVVLDGYGPSGIIIVHMHSYQFTHKLAGKLIAFLTVSVVS